MHPEKVTSRNVSENEKTQFLCLSFVYLSLKCLSFILLGTYLGTVDAHETLLLAP